MEPSGEDQKAATAAPAAPSAGDDIAVATASAAEASSEQLQG